MYVYVFSPVIIITFILTMSGGIVYDSGELFEDIYKAGGEKTLKDKSTIITGKSIHSHVKIS